MLVALFPLLGALLGGLQVINTSLSAESAPQQAAGMAMACAYAVVPYVFARSIEMLTARPPSRPLPHEVSGPAVSALPGERASRGGVSMLRGRETIIGVVLALVIALILSIAKFAQ